MRRIYLDHTATTPLDERVEAAMRPFHREVFGNASSVHAHGRAARAALEDARSLLARLIGCTPGELTFTSGGTESNCLAVLGAGSVQRKAGRGEVITCAAEHLAVLEPCRVLEERGHELTVLPAGADGSCPPGSVAGAVSRKTGLVTVMHSNNEVGTISNVRQIAADAHTAGAIVHTDAVQSFGKVPLRVDELGVDLMSLSAHKLYGPKGIGALYIRNGIAVDPVQRGGGQEWGRRAGTESVHLVVGFAEAARIATEEMAAESKRLAALRDELERELRARFPALLVNGEEAERLPHVLSVSFSAARAPMEGEMLLVNMDLEGVSVASGSACTSGSVRPSHVLLAMGRDPATAAATIRFAFGRGNTRDDVGAAVQALTRSLGRMGMRAP